MSGTLMSMLTQLDDLSPEEMKELHKQISERLGRKTDWQGLVLAIEGLREGLSDEQLDKIETAMAGIPEAEAKS